MRLYRDTCRKITEALQKKKEATVKTKKNSSEYAPDHGSGGFLPAQTLRNRTAI
jgi:hypothetical protein